MTVAARRSGSLVNHFLENRFRFRQFRVYQDARDFDRSVREVVRVHFPIEERYRLSAQLVRTVDSIVLNIAEGSERSTDRDFANFLTMARASLNEAVACFGIAHDHRYITRSTLDHWLQAAAHLAGQLTAFRRRLLDHPTK